MRELSTCDFCGSEAAGVYEVVPGDIPDVSARRMVLCEGCRDTLADIVDPLLEAGRAGGRAKSQTESGVREAADAEPETEPESDPEPSPEHEPAPEPSIEPEPVPSTVPESEPGQEPDRAPSKPERVERPDGYGKVVRLVENRDDGIERSDLEELATSAYDLNHADVDEAIDFAIEQGTFQETTSGLKTT